ncbi:MAG: twin-arginine translocase TatA/TatE family subunit [Pseudomonadota bacterium]
MGIGWPQLLIIALVVLVLFGRGRIAEMMGDFGKGISSFKKGMSEEVDDTPASKAQIEAPAKDVSPSESKTSEPSDTAS